MVRFLLNLTKSDLIYEHNSNQPPSWIKFYIKPMAVKNNSKYYKPFSESKLQTFPEQNRLSIAIAIPRILSTTHFTKLPRWPSVPRNKVHEEP